MAHGPAGHLLNPLHRPSAVDLVIQNAQHDHTAENVDLETDVGPLTAVPLGRMGA